MILAVVVLAGVAAGAWRLWLGSGAQDPAELVPASAFFYFALDVRPGNPSVQQLKPFLDKAQSTGLTDETISTVEKQLSQAGAKLSFKEDVLPWAGGRVGLAVLDLPVGTMAGQQDGGPTVVLVLSARDGRRARQALEKVAGQAPQGPSGAAAETYKRVRLLQLTSAPIAWYGALIEGSVVVGPREALTQIVDLSRNPGRGEKSGRLSDAPAYRAVLKELPSRPLATSYLNLGRMRDELAGEIGRALGMGEEAARNTTALFGGMEAVGGAVTADRSGVRCDWVCWGAVSDPVISKLATLPAVGGEVSRFAPASSVVYIGLPSPARQWSVFREQMIRLDPKAEQGLDEQARDLRDATGLDLETDILGWMTGEVALAGFDITSGDMPFQAALVAEASDDGAADRAVEKILGYLRRFPTEEHTHGGASLTAVTVPGEEGVRPTLGRQGRFVLLATSPEAAMKALDAHADPAKSLVESAGYREMRSRLGSAQQGLLFADVERALREVQAAFREEIGQEPEVKQALDQARVLKAIGSGGHSLANGATGTLYLAVDYDQLAAAIKELQRVIERARQKAQQITCASNLRQLALATLMYASDYDDQLPPADNWVAALHPYLPNRDILRCPSAPGQPGAYAYNSLAAGQRLSDLPPDMVLFFETSKNESNPADDGTSVVARHPGGTNYAFVDGHVAASTAPPRFAP
jgi:prepilin-type processing-associated H-X9-DG protein